MSVVLDKATAFRNEISGSTTNKIVCKASSRELAGPKKKHVDFLIHLTNDPHCSIPTLADLLNDRMRNSSWVIVFKALIVSHNLMTLGNEKYLQCLATKANNFQLEAFTDRSDALATDMSVHLRKYAKYLSFVCTAYRNLALDVCRAQKGEHSPFRPMDPVQLLKATGIVQQQLDYLLEIELTSGELTNGVVNTAFLMLYKDLIKLYSVYNDALINLLEKFFEMKKAHCKEAVEIYRKFLTRQEAIQTFLQLAEDVGVDRQAHLNLRQVPGDLLPALETHIGEMDTVKKTGAAPSPAIKAASEKLAKLREQPVERDLSPSTPPTSPGDTGMPSASPDVLEAQRKRFEELKRQSKASKPSAAKNKPNASPSAATRTPTIQTTPISNVIEKSPEDIEFDQIAVSSATTSKPLDDLLGLDASFTTIPAHVPAPVPAQHLNPWGTPTTTAAVHPSGFNPFLTPQQQLPSQTQPADDSVGTDPWSAQKTGYQEVDLFSEIRGGQPDFDSVFGGQAGRAPPPSSSSASFHRGGSLGEILQPTAVGVHATVQPPRQAPQLTKDVESSLVRAAEAIELSGSTKTGMTKRTEHQWKPVSDPVKTGGPNWQHQRIQPTTLPPGQMAAAGSAKGGMAADWKGGMYAGYFPSQPPQTVVPPVQQPYMMHPGAPMNFSGPMVWPQHQPFPQQQDPFGSIGTRPAGMF